MYQSLPEQLHITSVNSLMHAGPIPGFCPVYPGQNLRCVPMPKSFFAVLLRFLVGLQSPHVLNLEYTFSSTKNLNLQSMYLFSSISAHFETQQAVPFLLVSKRFLK